MLSADRPTGALDAPWPAGRSSKRNGPMRERVMGEIERPVFSGIYETYRPRVRAWAVKWLGPSEADDVSQEVFVKVERSLESLSDPANLGSWIYAITLNTVRDALRRRRSRPAGSSESLDAPAGDGRRGPAAADIPDSQSPSPEDAAIRNEMIACYLEYVEQLPPTYREVYLLAELGDLSSTDIAGRLGITPGNVKIRLHRARALLYEQLRANCRCYVNRRGEILGEPRRDR